MYRLRCFGTVALEDEEGTGLELRSRKHFALLLYLLAHRGRAFPRERLASLFWDTEPRLARHSLSQALYDVRTKLPGVEFDTSRGRVGAGAERIRYDGEQFEEAVRGEDRERAVRLYRGRFAPDVEEVGDADFVRWVESERQRYRRLAEMALYRHVRASRDRAEWGELCVSATRLLDMNPLSEDAHRALMRGLWLQGEQAAAVRHFEEAEAFLARELPGGISEETRDLVDRIRSSRPPSGAGSGGGDRPVEMVGRQQEFARLTRVLEEVGGDGVGGLVRIHGEAGVGKTRLLEELRGVAALDGSRVAESRCYAAESDVPYGPVVDGLRELADALACSRGDGEGEGAYHELGHLFPEAFAPPEDGGDAFAEPEAGRRRLFEEAADLVRRATREGPVVWLLEDAHWMDASSASLIHYLTRRLADRPFLLVLTARTHEETSGATEELLEDESDSIRRVVDLALGPLAREQTARLVASVLDREPAAETVDRIHELAGGNPFYALELLRTRSLREETEDEPEKEDSSADVTADRMTSGLKALLRRRLRGLGSDSLRVMETVAVSGRHATPSVLREATSLSTDELATHGQPLYERGLLRDGEDGPEFAHDITRDFVYASMGGLQRSALHLSVGEILAGREPPAGPATLARHFMEGGDRTRAYEFALEAARDAERRHAHQEAIQMAEMAVELAADEDESIPALQVLARAELASSELVLARQHLLELRDLTSEHGNGTDEIRARLHIDLARLTIELGHWEEAKGWLEEASQSLPGSEGPHLERRLECLHLQLKRSLLANDSERATSVRNIIVSLIDKFDDRDLSSASRVLAASSLAAYDLYNEAAEKARSRLQTLTDLRGVPPSIHMTCKLLKGCSELHLALWDRSRETFRSAFSTAEEYNDIIGKINSLNNMMCISLDTGDFREARAYQNEIRPLLKATPEALSCAVPPRLNVAEMLFLQGQYRKGADHYRKLKRKVERNLTGDSVFTASINAGLGLCLLTSGDEHEASRILNSMSDSEWEISGDVSSKDTIIWFRGYMLWDDDPEYAESYVKKWGHKESANHKVVSRRLLWLATLFSERLGPNSETTMANELYHRKEAQLLRDVDNGWFLRVSARWLDAVVSRSLSVD